MYEVHGDKRVRDQSRVYVWTGVDLYAQVLKRIEPALVPNAKVLDIGAYPGSFLKILKTLYSSLALSLYGCGLVCEADEVGKFHQRARENPATNVETTSLKFKDYMSEQGISFFDYDLERSGDFDREPIAAHRNTFDIITCTEVIEHLHLPYRLMDLCGALLKPGGICVVETNNVRWLPGIARLIGGFQSASNLDWELVDRYEPFNSTLKRPHSRFYSIQELRTLMARAGLQVVESYDFNWGYPVRTLVGNHRFKRVLSNMIAIPGFRSHILVKARKPV